MRVLVCGGRDFGDWGWICGELDALLGSDPTMEVVCGYDPESKRFQGADELAYRWAARSSIPCHPFPADWHTHGRAAGPIRNQRMIDEGKPDLVVAFPGGKGTADMVARAEGAGIEVRRVTA